MLANRQRQLLDRHALEHDDFHRAHLDVPLKRLPKFAFNLLLSKIGRGHNLREVLALIAVPTYGLAECVVDRSRLPMLCIIRF
jgi:hypothetical protein